MPVLENSRRTKFGITLMLALGPGSGCAPIMPEVGPDASEDTASAETEHDEVETALASGDDGGGSDDDGGSDDAAASDGSGDPATPGDPDDPDASCVDGVSNQGEVDVDCGGPCGPCGQGAGAFNYGEAMQKAIVFFGANQLGELSPLNRFEWRQDAVLYEGRQVGRDLSGGYANGGDNILFGKTMGITLVMLGWTAYQLEPRITPSGQMPALLDAIRHGTDWIVNKAHVRGTDGTTQQLFVQLSNAVTDHTRWNSMEEWSDTRPVYSVDPSRPGSDVAALFAAGLSASSLAFRPHDEAYADRLLEHAQVLYQFATDYRGLMEAHVDTLYTNYNGDEDELSHAATWLYLATEDPQYLADAEQLYPTYFDQWSGPSYEHSEIATALLLAMATGQPQYRDAVDEYLTEFTAEDGFGGVINRSDYGFCYFLTGSGTFSQSMAMTFIASMYADAFGDATAADIARSHVDFVLGANPLERSFMGGFGHDPPRRFHHRNASGGSLAPDGDNAHVLVGGLPRGFVNHDADFLDQRSLHQYTGTSIALNAAVVGSLAYLYGTWGGQPLSDPALAQEPGLH